jgi:spore germination protein YaaH
LSTDAAPPEGTEATGTEPDDGTADDASPPGRRRRWVVLGALATLLVAVVAVTVVVLRAEDRPPPRPDIPLDTWAPYWALDRSADELPNRVGSMREVSPFWFNAVGETEIVVDPNASAELAEDMIDTIRRSDARLVPSIVDATASGEMAAILADPERRSNHVETLLAFAAEGDYDGLDIDYEQFAFADGRSTWASTRPGWVAFIEELAAGLHAQGRTLTVSIPPVYDDEQTAESGFWVYDYGAIAPHVDRIRIMAYDYSVGEAGPIAPLAFVESAIEGALAATDAPEKLVLGLPAYGRNWPVFVSGDCPDDAPGVTAVTARTVDELVEQREATPVYVEATGEWTFEYELEVGEGDEQCVRSRMDLAREYRLDGVSLWALGFEDDTVWDAILPTVSTATTDSTTGTDEP